jgi:hypothetical protein
VCSRAGCALLRARYTRFTRFTRYTGHALLRARRDIAGRDAACPDHLVGLSGILRILRAAGALCRRAYMRWRRPAPHRVPLFSARVRRPTGTGLPALWAARASPSAATTAHSEWDADDHSEWDADDMHRPRPPGALPPRPLVRIVGRPAETRVPSGRRECFMDREQEDDEGRRWTARCRWRASCAPWRASARGLVSRTADGGVIARCARQGWRDARQGWRDARQGWRDARQGWRDLRARVSAESGPLAVRSFTSF